MLNNSPKSDEHKQSNAQAITIKLSAIQLSSTTRVADNLAAITRQLAEITKEKVMTNLLPSQHHHLVVLPECCLFFGGQDSEQLVLAEKNAVQNTLLEALSRLAQQFKVFLVAGTIPILTSQGDKFTNSSCVFNPKGELLGRYDKIHLFDVMVSDNTQQYCESRYTQAGDQVNVIKTGFATIGLSVCFDLRFPVLFNQLTAQGASIITVPSAFTRVTGKAHWQALLQARAIENQVYIIAAGQEGIHENGRKTWGHSMIISPWGEVLACLPQQEGYVSVDFKMETVQNIRESMPMISPL